MTRRSLYQIESFCIFFRVAFICRTSTTTSTTSQSTTSGQYHCKRSHNSSIPANVTSHTPYSFILVVICSAVTYTQSFTSGVTPTSQCTAWSSYVASLTCAGYSNLRLYGSNDATGLTITELSVVRGLAAALRTSSTFSGNASGYTWVAGTGVAGLGISNTGVVSSCSTGYTLRPCIGNYNWGGINGADCSAPSQTISLTIQWSKQISAWHDYVRSVSHFIPLLFTQLSVNKLFDILPEKVALCWSSISERVADRLRESARAKSSWYISDLLKLNSSDAHVTECKVTDESKSLSICSVEWTFFRF